jgi:hypothetical protein
MSERWRLAVMFDAHAGRFDALAAGLGGAAGQIARIAGEGEVRLGVADRHPDLGGRDGAHEVERWRTVDGAVEITVPAARAGELSELARGLRALVDPLAAPGSVEVMAGPVHAMVPPRPGGAFLSLAFRRDPAITAQQFRDWWRYRHAGVAIPVLGAALLGYDQVHVDPAATQAVARAYGVEPVPYDAYDNLTYVDRQGFLDSVADAEGMARVFADEIGHIDDATRRYALMRRVA